MENTFQNSWRTAVLPLLLTAVVVGSALAFALS
jgi:ABC-type spermidine/putrescine transport system permease subunit II